VSAFLATNVLVRHLTADPPALARRASAFLATADELLLPDLSVAEVVSVLESFYEVERARVAELVRAVIAFPAIIVVDAPLLLRALEVYELERIDFAEATSWRAQRRAELVRSRRSTGASIESRRFGESSRPDWDDPSRRRPMRPPVVRVVSVGVGIDPRSHSRDRRAEATLQNGTQA
jgi:predicted nucleic-acid-binding protein